MQSVVQESKTAHETKVGALLNDLKVLSFFGTGSLPPQQMFVPANESTASRGGNSNKKGKSEEGWSVAELQSE